MNAAVYTARMQDSTLGARIRHFRMLAGMTQADLGRAAHLSRAEISELEHDKRKAPAGETLQAVAAALGTNVARLLRGAAGSDGTEQLIPIGVLAARIPASDAWPADAEYVPAVAPADHLVGVRVRGDCMAPKIEDGDVVVVDKTRVSPELGRVVVWWSQGAWTLKRLRRHNGTWLLVPDNPAYPPIEIDPGQSCILGVVVRVVKPEP
jgi:DNA polymerase V